MSATAVASAETASAEVSLPHLRRAVAFASQFTSDDENRPVLGRVEVSICSAGVWVAATDSYAMGWAFVRGIGSDVSYGVGAPPVAAKPSASVAVDPVLLAASCRSQSDEVRLDIDDGKLFVTIATSIPLAGMEKFPAWRPLAANGTSTAIDQPRPGKPHVDAGRLAKLCGAFALGDPEAVTECDCDCGCEECCEPDRFTVVPIEAVELTAPADLPEAYRFATRDRWALLMPVRVR